MKKTYVFRIPSHSIPIKNTCTHTMTLSVIANSRFFHSLSYPLTHMDSLEHQKTYCPSKGYKVRPLKMIKQRTNCGRGKSALLFGFLGSPRVQLARQCLLLALGSSPLPSAGNRTGIKRLTLWSKLSLHKSPQTAEQITAPSPAGAKNSAIPPKKLKIFALFLLTNHSTWCSI